MSRKGQDAITNSDDTIDSRDVIDRIEYLQDEQQSAAEEGSIEAEAWEDSEEGAELKALLALQEEASGTPDWRYGETLIRDSHFQDYAQQLAEDIGCDISDQWPMRCIDWEQAARELRMDYFSVDFDGVTYWVRS